MSAVPPGEAVVAFAPAKINLYLHVLGRRPDGYHRLDSLVAFADIGDEVVAAPGAALSLALDGPEAAALAGLGEDNLVLRAARGLAAAHGVAPAAQLRLDKRLPIASGIGGGSSDAAAALRALAALWRVPLDAAAMRLAGALGADVPACLDGRPAWIGGIGERIAPLPELPALGIVLVNPRRELATASVFRTREGAFTAREVPRADRLDTAGLLALLRGCRNDLTESATRLLPEIAAVLDRLEKLPRLELARMSGSGATCFGLFARRSAADEAAARLAAENPHWWVRAGALLSGPAPLRLSCAAR
ncbi:MAG TPA: 4-(cytidine 5'-diphospho)-2-C-methyl-D-erythritol kinase [Stellaceae bacterium]|nr:4-(cytidine 5'-diphospho)-2-C-methyl-D-erythritol kinase [Stellaceae bacterium]